MKSKNEIAKQLTAYWKEYLEKEGFEIRKNQAEDFILRTYKYKGTNFKTVVMCLTHPYYFSYFLNFISERKKVLKSFWRFSSKLLKFKILLKEGTIDQTDWDKYVSEYLQHTLGSHSEESKHLITYEVLKYLK